VHRDFARIGGNDQLGDGGAKSEPAGHPLGILEAVKH
jgi:hypothetical protein